jgi:hypothetical protein
MSKVANQHTPAEIRALDVLDCVPPGCKLELVTDGFNAPHLRPGEFAVADLTDRQVIPGELYLIRWPQCGGRAIVQINVRPFRGVDGQDHRGIWFSPLCRATRKADGSIDRTRPYYQDSGPLKPEALPAYLMGRIIGVFQAPEIDGPDALPPPDLQIPMKPAGSSD